MHEEQTSKTSKKKAMLALQDLGAQLLTLNAQQLANTPLPDDLRAAVEEARRLTRHGARRRQLQYIGRLMRETDVAPIQESLDAWHGRGREHTVRLHEIERWRDALLADDPALARFLQLHPGADSQKLRALIRSARHEQSAALAPRSYRELFRFLRDATESKGLPAD